MALINTLERMADNNIALLHMKCTRGIYSQKLFSIVSNGQDRFYNIEKLSWMKPFVYGTSQQIAAGCLECLCMHGMDLNDFNDVIESRINDRIFSLKVIEIAEKKNNPDSLMRFVEAGSVYLNRVIIALKKTGNDSYLVPLMVSGDSGLESVVNRITESNYMQDKEN